MKTPIHNSVRIGSVLLIAAVVMTLPIYWFGMPGGNDLAQHYRFMQTFYAAIHTGDLYPAWPGDTNLGFGDVGIRFYPPLAYFVTALIRSLTDGWSLAIASSICFWFFVGGAGVFLLAREWFSEKASLMAAVIFMAMPYHANQVYNAGLFAEFAGFAILPFCFFFLRRTMTSGRMSGVVGLAISFALLILTHLPTVIIGSIGLTVFAVANIDRRRLAPDLLRLSGAVTIALAASSFYWVRMVVELSLVSHTLPQFSDRNYGFRQNFLASILHVPWEEYGETSLWFTDILLGITAAMILPFIAIFWIRRRAEERRVIFPLLAVLAVSLFVSTAASSLLWEQISVLQKIQFPWRFLGLISLIGSVLVAAGLDELHGIFSSRLRPLGLIAVGLLLAGFAFTAAQVIRPAAYSSREEFDKNFDRFRTNESFECWWPVSANHLAFANRQPVSSDNGDVEVLEWSSDEREFLVYGRQELRVATFYYPLWKATADTETQNIEVHPSDDGAILVSVPEGATRLRLTFHRPTYEIASRHLSLATWAIIVMLVGASIVTRRRV